MKIWSAKLPQHRRPEEADRDQHRVHQLLRELEVKQKQLLKLVDQRETNIAKNVLTDQQNEVKGKFADAVELLVLFTKECQEDAKEIKWKLEETSIEIGNHDRQIKSQEAELRGLKMELTELEQRVEIVRKKYKEIHPELKHRGDGNIETDITDAKRALKHKSVQLEQFINDAGQHDADPLLELIKKEQKQWKKAKIEQIQGNIFRVNDTLAYIELEKGEMIASFNQDGKVAKTTLKRLALQK